MWKEGTIRFTANPMVRQEVGDAEYENSRDRLFGNILYGPAGLGIISNTNGPF
jgi:hypothetical protein